MNDMDATEAARLTGLPFEFVIRTDWGLQVFSKEIPASFCFHFKREKFECGIPGLLTPNIHLIVDFLRSRGYDFAQPETHDIFTVQKEKIGSGL